MDVGREAKDVVDRDHDRPAALGRRAFGKSEQDAHALAPVEGNGLLAQRRHGQALRTRPDG